MQVSCSVDQAKYVLSSVRVETLFEMPGPSYDTIKLRFHSEASKHGHFRPPDFFYEGVVYGLTWQNSHDLDVSNCL